jgi:spartin
VLQTRLGICAPVLLDTRFLHLSLSSDLRTPNSLLLPHFPLAFLYPAIEVPTTHHSIMSGHGGEPRLLYSIAGIRAYHLQPSGAQTLSLLMVPTNSPFADLSNVHGQNEAPEEDFYLHLNLPPELDLPLPATTQIYHQPPRSYLIPRWDLGPESGAFTRIEFPQLGTGPGTVTQEDVDTFETILAQCTAFLERAQAPQSSKGGAKPYNPQNYKPGEGYAGTGNHGEIVLVNEDNGSVVGELAGGAQIVEDPRLQPGSKSEFTTALHPQSAH